MPYYYGGRLFRTVKNTAGGQVNNDTIFQYQQHHDRLTVTYSGGPIEYGHMLGWIGPGGHIDFVYHHIWTVTVKSLLAKGGLALSCLKTGNYACMKCGNGPAAKMAKAPRSSKSFKFKMASAY